MRWYSYSKEIVYPVNADVMTDGIYPARIEVKITLQFINLIPSINLIYSWRSFPMTVSFYAFNWMVFLIFKWVFWVDHINSTFYFFHFYISYPYFNLSRILEKIFINSKVNIGWPKWFIKRNFIELVRSFKIY